MEQSAQLRGHDPRVDLADVLERSDAVIRAPDSAHSLVGGRSIGRSVGGVTVPRAPAHSRANSRAAQLASPSDATLLRLVADPGRQPSAGQTRPEPQFQRGLLVSQRLDTLQAFRPSHRRTTRASQSLWREVRKNAFRHRAATRDTAQCLSTYLLVRERTDVACFSGARRDRKLVARGLIFPSSLEVFLTRPRPSTRMTAHPRGPLSDIACVHVRQRPVVRPGDGANHWLPWHPWQGHPQAQRHHDGHARRSRAPGARMERRCCQRAFQRQERSRRVAHGMGIHCEAVQSTGIVLQMTFSRTRGSSSLPLGLPGASSQ